MEVYRIGNVEIKRDWRTYTVNALPEAGVDPNEINGTFSRLHSLLSRVLPEIDFKMRSLKQEHVVNTADLNGLPPFRVEGDLMLGADPSDPTRQCKATFNSILGGIYAGQIAHGVEQHLSESGVSAVAAELGDALGQAKRSLPKLRTLAGGLSPAEVEVIEEFLGSTVGALRAAKKLEETVVASQNNVHAFLTKAADVPSNAVLSPDELAASVAAKGSRISSEYISVRGNAGTRVHALIEAQMRQIKQSGVWEWTDAEAAGIKDATAVDINRAKLVIERLQSDFGCVPEDILAIETAVLMPSLGASGTADMILRVGGKAVIVDWKTQKTVTKEIAWQLAGYRSGAYWLLDDGVARVTRAKNDRPALVATYRDQVEKLLSAEPDEMPAIRDQVVALRQQLATTTEKEPVMVQMPNGQEYEVSPDALVVHLPAGPEEAPVLEWYLVNVGDGVVDALEELVQMANNVDAMMTQFEGRGSDPLLRKIQPLQVSKVWQTVTRPEPKPAVEQAVEAKPTPAMEQTTTRSKPTPKPAVEQAVEAKPAVKQAASRSKAVSKPTPKPTVEQAVAKTEPQTVTRPEPKPAVEQATKAAPTSDTQKRNVRASLEHYGAKIIAGYKDEQIEDALEDILATMNCDEQPLKMREAISAWVAQHDVSNLTVV